MPKRNLVEQSFLDKIEKSDNDLDDSALFNILSRTFRKMGIARDDLPLTGHNVIPGEPELPRRITFALTLGDYAYSVETGDEETPLFYARLAAISSGGLAAITAYDPDMLERAEDGMCVYSMREGGKIADAILASYDVTDWI